MTPGETAQAPLVLVVDDVDHGREIFAEYLEFRGFRVATAADGLEALEKAFDLHPDVILMDLSLPGMDGWEATRELRANAETKDIPILAATALFRDSDLKTCLEAGCNGYIVKPFTFQELQGKVRELIPATSTTYPL